MKYTRPEAETVTFTSDVATMDGETSIVSTNQVTPGD